MWQPSGSDGHTQAFDGVGVTEEVVEGGRDGIWGRQKISQLYDNGEQDNGD